MNIYYFIDFPISSKVFPINTKNVLVDVLVDIPLNTQEYVLYIPVSALVA